MADKAQHGTVLVIDDHLGDVSGSFYNSTNFKSDYENLPFRFVFSTAWSEREEQFTVEEAIQAVKTNKPDGVLLDIVFGEKQRLGLDILRRLTSDFPKLPVIMMTGVERNEVWPDCVRLGAVDYLLKMPKAWLFAQTLDRYVGAEPIYWLIGQDSLFLDAINNVAMAAVGGRSSVTITGEPGTGKELLARFLHRHGERSGEKFEKIDLKNIPDNLLPNELWGHEADAYSGARKKAPGRLQNANNGVVFLDEIGNISQEAQANLLQATADKGEVAKIGGGEAERLNIQFVAATNANISSMTKRGEFREDLYHRLCANIVHLPSLSNRRDDVLLLLRHMLRYEAIECGKRVPELPREMEIELEQFPWTGNVRGLGRYAQRVFNLAKQRYVEPDEAIFREALELEAKNALHISSTEAPTERPLPTGAVQGSPAAGALSPVERIQQLRLDELGQLLRALEQTRDSVTGAANRAKAAALLKGKPKCSTNEFDRWIKALCDELTPENRNLAVQRFPELSAVLKDTIGN